MKLFLRYVDDIVRTVRGELSCLLHAANIVHPNLQFTLEKTNSKGNLMFLDLNIIVSQGRRVICSWYQKPTDTGTILNYRICAQLSISVVLSMVLYTGFFLGVHLAGSNLITLWKLIGRNG